MVTKSRSSDLHHRKRHGLHQKQTKHFMRTYLPYLPLLSIVGFGLAISNFWQPPVQSTKNGVLAYATNTTISGLLSETNSQRSAVGKSSLGLNSLLNDAAQAKANDMVARNYWSHATPDGAQPWTFIDSAGYDYAKAGENLAYGFLTSSDTIAGWMNSPPHKENMLDGDFTEVGFGYANSESFNSSGNQTVVVAMYAKPMVAAAVTPAPTAPKATPKAPTSAVIAENDTTPPEDAVPVETAPAEPVAEKTSIPNTEQSTLESTPTTITRVQALTDGRAPWSVAAIAALSGLCLLYIALKHALAIRRMLVHGEQFILHHALLDITLVSLVLVGYLLTRTVGTIL